MPAHDVYRTRPAGLGPIAYALTPSWLVVTWAEVERVLGRPYGYTLEDDAKLQSLVVAAGAPAWAGIVGGKVDEEGWCLQVPRPRAPAQ